MKAGSPVSRQFYLYNGRREDFPLAAVRVGKLSDMGLWREIQPGLLACRLAVPLPSAGTPEAGYRLIPSFSARTPSRYGFRFAADCRRACDGGMDALVTLDFIGEGEIDDRHIVSFSDLKDHQRTVPEPNIDFFEGLTSLRALFLFVSGLTMSELEEAACCIGITVLQNVAPPDCSAPEQVSPAITLQVPAISQMMQDPAIANRICSPVNTAMVLQGFGIDAPPIDVAKLAYSRQRDFYGVWPFSIWAASRFGVIGAVTALGSWIEAQDVLARNIPIVATLTYGANELAGAAVPSTKGHLVTIRGIGDEFVSVNDPGADSLAAVERCYRRDEFGRAWFGNKQGVCYIFARPG